MGDALPGSGCSPMGLHPASRAVVPKERFCRDYNWLAGSSPIFLMLIGLCHVIKTTKMADTLEKALTFQTETNILHYYKGILLLKLLWQIQNYQLILCGSRDWSLGIWLTAFDGFAISVSDPDPSGSISLTPHPNLVVNSVGYCTMGYCCADPHNAMSILLLLVTSTRVSWQH